MSRKSYIGSVENQDADATNDRFLHFSIGSESFVAPLLSIREIVEPLVYQAVPNPFDFYLGLANLRGQIVGVLDLGQWFKLTPAKNCEGGAFLIFEVDGIAMAGFVHKVNSVVVISPDEIDTKCRFKTTIPTSGLKGVARVAARLVPVVDLPELIRKDLQVAS